MEFVAEEGKVVPLRAPKSASWQRDCRTSRPSRDAHFTRKTHPLHPPVGHGDALGAGGGAGETVLTQHDVYVRSTDRISKSNGG